MDGSLNPGPAYALNSKLSLGLRGKEGDIEDFKWLNPALIQFWSSSTLNCSYWHLTPACQDFPNFGQLPAQEPDDQGQGQVFLADLLADVWRVLGGEVVLSSSFPFSGPVFPPQDSSLHLYLQHTARGLPFLTLSPKQLSRGSRGDSNPHPERQAHQVESPHSGEWEELGVETRSPV